MSIGGAASGARSRVGEAARDRCNRRRSTAIRSRHLTGEESAPALGNSCRTRHSIGTQGAIGVVARVRAGARNRMARERTDGLNAGPRHAPAPDTADRDASTGAASRLSSPDAHRAPSHQLHGARSRADGPLLPRRSGLPRHHGDLGSREPDRGPVRLADRVRRGGRRAAAATSARRRPTCCSAPARRSTWSAPPVTSRSGWTTSRS